MDATTIQLLNMIVHLVEYIDTGEPLDIAAAKSSLNYPEVAEALEPGVLLPVTRSGKSVAQMLEDK